MPSVTITNTPVLEDGVKSISFLDSHGEFEHGKTTGNGGHLQPLNHGATHDTESLSGDTIVTSAPPVRRTDEYDVNFEDNRAFAVQRWNDIAAQTTDRLSESDKRLAATVNSWDLLAVEMQNKMISPSSSVQQKREMGRIQPLPQVLGNLRSIFQELVAPQPVLYDILWGLIFITLKMSYSSKEVLKRTTNLLNKVRRVAGLFLLTLEACEERNEKRVAIVDFLDPVTALLSDYVEFLHDCEEDPTAERSWPDIDERLDSNFELLDQCVKHVNDITSFSKVNVENNIKNMSLKHALIANTDEPGTFPNKQLPFAQNPKFYGRREEMDKMIKHLSVKTEDSYRTYTIYGRRGVGKTQLALQFAYTNPARYDAIFWIQCENSVSIRQSFTNVAVSLNLPGAYKDGHHEENLMAVHNWLKRTAKKWLLIFDNAESTQILRQYWPMGAAGAILLTSRKYYNFTKDVKRKGDTVKPFGEQESWELLLELLGEDWKQAEQENRISHSEIIAAKKMLKDLEGLPLAIQQAAILIKDSKIGGPTIAKTYSLFRDRIENLPERHSTPRSTSERALDALWDMTFNSLSKNARALLGVFAWLSPDAIPTELFLPRNQKILDPLLTFCRQDAIHVNEDQVASLISVTTASLDFEKAIHELLKTTLIKQDNLNYSIHRVVQEATSYHDIEDLQTSFATAAALVDEQFPRRSLEGNDGGLFEKWNRCQEYIPHGVYLSKKFMDYHKTLKGTPEFVVLLGNCGWYLYEIGDYAVSAHVTDTALIACNDRNSLAFADLHNTNGARLFDLNQLKDCRKEYSEVRRVREALLPPDHLGIAAILHNFGNLELAIGNGEEASKLYEEALELKKAGGDQGAISLALTYLCIGRTKMLQGLYADALKQTTLAESLFLRTIGADKGFILSVHYLAGNIHYLLKHWDHAFRSYDACLKLALHLTPIHPITREAYYSLACVEFARDPPNIENAKNYLEKARTIGQLRSPDRDDGPLARINWKLATVLESDTLGRYGEEATGLRRRAEVRRNELMAEGEGGAIAYAEEYPDQRNEEEDAYDAMVPLFYR